MASAAIIRLFVASVGCGPLWVKLNNLLPIERLPFERHWSVFMDSRRHTPSYSLTFRLERIILDEIPGVRRFPDGQSNHSLKRVC